MRSALRITAFVMFAIFGLLFLFNLRSCTRPTFMTAYKAYQRAEANERCGGNANCLREVFNSFQECFTAAHEAHGSKHTFNAVVFETCAHPGNNVALGRAIGLAASKGTEEIDEDDYASTTFRGSATAAKVRAAGEQAKAAAAASSESAEAPAPKLGEEALAVAGLHVAVQTGKVDEVRATLDAHPEYLSSTFGAFGLSLVHQGVHAPSDEMLKLLLARHAPLELHSTYDGATALHLAVVEGREGATRLLLDGGANANAVRTDGATPLHAALLADRPEAIVALVTHGADVNARMKDGRTPLAIAKKMRDPSLSVLLESKGAI